MHRYLCMEGEAEWEGHMLVDERKRETVEVGGSFLTLVVTVSCQAGLTPPADNGDLFS